MLLRQKIVLLFVVSLFFTGLSIGTLAIYDLSQLSENFVEKLRKQVMAEKQVYLKDLVGQAISTAKACDEKYGDQAQSIAIEILSASRFQKGSAYFFAYDTSGGNVVKFAFHGMNPQLNEKVTNIEKPDIKGYPYRKILLEAASKGGGFATYSYDKKDAETGVVTIIPKITYIESYEPWQWAIACGIYFDDIDAMVEARKREIENQRMVMIQQMAGLSCVMIVLACIVCSLVLKKALGGVLKAAEIAEMLADGSGDLRRRIDIDTPDETGRLAKAINRLVEHFAGLIKDLESKGMHLNNGAQKISSQADHLSEEARNMALHGHSVTVAVEEFSTNISTIAAATEQTSVNVDRVSEAAEGVALSMSALAESMVDLQGNMSSIDEAAQRGAQVATDGKIVSEEASQIMQELGRASENINKVTDTIKTIASQTNLLALNATIEAASAGDAGKGFTVVAGEIKALAQQSSKAAEEIAVMISVVQTGVGKALDVNGKIGHMILSIDGISEEIKASTRQQMQITDGFADKIQQSNEGTGSVTNAMLEISKAVGELSKNAAESSSAANEISESVGKINHMIVASQLKIDELNQISSEFTSMAASIELMTKPYTI